VAKQAKTDVRTGQSTETTGKATAQVDLKTVLPPRSEIALSDIGESRLDLVGAEKLQTSDPEVQEDLFTRPAIEVNSSVVPVSAADVYLHRLRAWKSLLDGQDDASIRPSAERRKAVLAEVFDENLAAIFAAQLPLEKSFRELALFYSVARQSPEDTNLPVTVANVSIQDLRKSQSLRKSFAEQIPKETEISQKALYGLIVIPGWLRDPELLKEFGELAENARALVITDFVDCSEEHLKENLKDLNKFKKLDSWMQRVVLVGNNFRVREANRYEPEGSEGVYLSAGALFAGRVFHHDDAGTMGDTVANLPILLSSADGSEIATRWHLTNRKKVLDLFNNSVIPLARSDDDLVFWGVETLSVDEYGKQYNVVRVQQYIDKCITHYLNKEAIFRLNSEQRRDELRRMLDEFLRENIGPGDDKMLEEGEVIGIVVGDEDDEIDVTIRLKFKHAISSATIDFRLVKDGGAFKSEKKES
jgi:Type VI secretion system, TssC, VipB